MPNRPLSDCQLLIDSPAEGAWNMAVDEALLGASSHSIQPTLRFYQWARPTLSLGYFQSYSERDSHQPSRDADVVRRLSGGGAILHDRELTYSLFLPASHPLSRDTQRLYNTVHLAIIRVLKTLLKSDCSWQPVLCEPTLQLAAEDEPFLCFQRRAKGDILLQETEAGTQSISHKIVGSAQRRRRGAVLQHGSILIGLSPAAPELSGITDVCDTKLTTEMLLAKLPDVLAEALYLKLLKCSLADAISLTAKQLQETKYQVSEWTAKR